MYLDLLWDVVLVSGFGLQHSFFATIRAKKVIKQLSKIDPLTWRGPQSLLNVLYVVIAASLWRPVDVVVWEFTGVAYWISLAVLALGWLWYFQIHIFEYDCGLAFGSTAAINNLLGRKSPPLELWKTGTRRWIRFPVHTAFFPMFLAFPVMRADLLVLGIFANIYNVIGTVLYDVRLKTLAGDLYHRYVDKTGLIWPPVYRNLPGAAAMDLPKPIHWTRPTLNSAGILLGLIGGLFYWQLLGLVRTNNSTSLWTAWGISAVWALLAGLVLGLASMWQLKSLLSSNFNHFQTQVSTNSAVISAVSLISWFVLAIANTGEYPSLAIVLPMWITVLWLAQASAVVLINLSSQHAAVTPPVLEG